MLLTTILNRIQHFKGFVYESARFRTKKARVIVVQVRSRSGSRGACSICGKQCAGYDHLPERLYQFVPLWNMRVELAYSARRVECAEHGVVVERVPWATGKQTTTVAFDVFLSQWARLLSWQEAANRFGTTWDTVRRAIEMVVDHGLEHRSLEGIHSIGVDEMAIGKGHVYATLVYQIDHGMRRLLWIGRDRTVKTLLHFFAELGPIRSAAIRYVCSDMWKPYLQVVARKIPQALNILDRFHIMRKFSEAIDDVRRKETQRLEKLGLEPLLTKSRWLLLKNPQNLTTPQRSHLKALLGFNLQAIRAYLLREDFQHFWTYSSAIWATKFLHEWIRRTMLSKIEPMKKVARMLKEHEPLILNWFVAHGTLSSGIVEAMNNTAKLTIKRSYGFRQYETLKYALYHKLGQLSPPELTHEFF
jgi:transposase